MRTHMHSINGHKHEMVSSKEKIS